VYGVLKLINFAHSEVFMIGTMGALLATKVLGIAAGPSATKTGIELVLILVLAGLFAMAASGVTAVLLERIAYRPLRRRGAGRLAALISAIGASLFLQEVFALRLGRNLLPFPRLMEKATVFHIFGAQVRNDQVLVIVGALVMMVALDRFVRTTRLGRGVRAVAQNAETAALMGVNIDRVVSVTFLLGGLMAGAAGLLYVVYLENTGYNIGFLLGIKAFTAAVMGGIGNLRGALVGGLALGLIENYGAAIWGAEWKDVISFTVLLIVLMFRPTGLLGESLSAARA
jgi:branched-chain amino acid transport system permease protein